MRLLRKENSKKFISLSQDEILGFGDEFINVNVTKLKKYVYYLIVSFGYILNGFFVGWSSQFFSFDEELSSYFNRSQISWIISGFPLGVVIISLLLLLDRNKLYYLIGTKLSLLGASLLILVSWTLVMPFGNQFEILILSRVLGGLGSGIIFILVPIYMKELMGAGYNGNIVDLLITQFGLGIFSQYLIDFLTPMQLSAIAITLSVVFTVICCLIPESPRYKAYCDMKYKHTYEFETAAKLHNLWSEEDLQRKSIVDLFNELKKLNLLSLIGLILAEQFIGGISILFYMKHYARLSGVQISPELVSTVVGLTLILSIPFSKLIKFSRISSTKKQLIISTMAILFCVSVLAAFCVAEGFLGHKLKFKGRDLVPLTAFVTVAFFYVVGISRNILLIMQHILSSYSLQLHLRTLSIAVTWFFIFAMTKILPQLLYLVGAGYFYVYMVILTLIALIFLVKIIPTSLNLEVDRATPNSLLVSVTVSSSSSTETKSRNPPSSSSSYNEVGQVEDT